MTTVCCILFSIFPFRFRFSPESKEAKKTKRENVKKNLVFSLFFAFIGYNICASMCLRRHQAKNGYIPFHPIFFATLQWVTCSHANKVLFAAASAA